MLSEPLDRQFLVAVECAKERSGPGQFGAAQFLRRATKFADPRLKQQPLQPLRAVLRQPLQPRIGAVPGFRRRLVPVKGFEVHEADVREFPDVWVDVAGHPQVDQKQRMTPGKIRSA